MTHTLQESIARALYASNDRLDIWDKEDEFVHQFFRNEAIAALDAISREHVVVPREMYAELVKCWAREQQEGVDDVMDRITDHCGYGDLTPPEARQGSVILPIDGSLTVEKKPSAEARQGRE